MPCQAVSEESGDDGFNDTPQEEDEEIKREQGVGSHDNHLTRLVKWLSWDPTKCQLHVEVMSSNHPVAPNTLASGLSSESEQRAWLSGYRGIRHKGLSSISFNHRNNGEDLGSQIELIAKWCTRRHVSDTDSTLLPSIFTDSLAQEIDESDNTVVALLPITQMLLPGLCWQQVTPESQFIGALDAPDSDPVDYYTYTSGPQPLRKFF
ncbi:hypothetical protein DFH06DRAFT_1154239 [Mycena polygramma]|nr:hypothetical protein DFH06DRAFT_1154239 [Mycena polygramma]